MRNTWQWLKSDAVSERSERVLAMNDLQRYATRIKIEDLMKIFESLQSEGARTNELGRLDLISSICRGLEGQSALSQLRSR